MMLIFIYVLITIVDLPSVTKATGSVKFDQYNVCPKGFLREEGKSEEFTARSHMDCMTRCSDTLGCHGFNVCPGDVPEQVSCGLTEELSSGSCDGLTAANSSQCYHVRKRQTAEKLLSTTHFWCRNGGTLNGDKCDCPVQYSGRACQRLIRDCSEPFENGYRTDMDGAYYIQPDRNENPFLVKCKFEYNGVTYALVQTYPATEQHDWNEYKQGFGDDPLNFTPYFIGLDNLHHLTRQASYELNIWLDYEGGATNGGVLYYNFTIGPEETMYEIAFDTLFKKYDVDDWFAGSSPVKFVAPGQDVGNCSSQLGKAGWLGSNCTGYGVFSTGDFYWPVNGELKKVTYLSLLLVRLSSFYEE